MEMEEGAILGPSEWSRKSEETPKERVGVLRLMAWENPLRRNKPRPSRVMTVCGGLAVSCASGCGAKRDRGFTVEPGKFFDRNWELSQFRNLPQSLNVAPGPPSQSSAILHQGMSFVVLITRETKLRMSLGDTRFEPPPLLPVCCMCGLVRDEQSSPCQGGRWMTQEMYRLAHGVSPTEFALTHTYCPECFAKTQQEVVRTFPLEPSALQ
jgi:hypothetical protein